MYYYLYQIRNRLNGKIYVGVHKTSNIDDGYMGSGKGIKSAIKKYGIENFSKEIIEWFDTEENMYDREIELVTEEFLDRNDVYNVKLGGPANFYYVNKFGLNHKVDQHLIHGNRIKIDQSYRDKFCEKMTEINRKNGPALSKKLLEHHHSKGKFWVSNDDLQKSKMVTEEEFLNMTGWSKGLRYRKLRARGMNG